MTPVKIEVWKKVDNNTEMTQNILNIIKFVQPNQLLISEQTFVPRKIGFWVWVLGWVLTQTQNQKFLYPNPKPKPKTQKFLYPNTKPKPSFF